MLHSSQSPTMVFAHRIGVVLDRTYMPLPSFDEGTAMVPAGTELGSGSWLEFCTDMIPAVDCRYRVMVACVNSWLALRSTECNSRWTRPCDVGGSRGYTSIFNGVDW